MLKPKRLEKTITDVVLNYMLVTLWPWPAMITTRQYVGVGRGEGGLQTKYFLI